MRPSERVKRSGYYSLILAVALAVGISAGQAIQPAFAMESPTKQALPDLLQEAQKKEQVIEARLQRERLEWYAKSRDIGFLDQVIEEAELSVKMGAAALGTRLRFLEEYEAALGKEALRSLLGDFISSAKGVEFDEAQVRSLLITARHLRDDYEARRQALGNAIKTDIDAFIAAEQEIQGVRLEMKKLAHLKATPVTISTGTVSLLTPSFRRMLMPTADVLLPRIQY